jgi:hypothetical protein
MDWNKGSNLAKSSGDVSTDSGQWSANQLATTTANYAEAPDESTTASKVTPDASQNYSGVIQSTSLTNGKTYTFSAYLRTESGSKTVNLLVLDGDSNFYNGHQSVTDTWQRYTNTFTVTGATGGGGLYITSYLDAKEFLVWGAQLVEGSEAGIYTPTLATAQTSDVLLPQGLTTGRDITGVNLFENVRKQGALNLDENSRASVHENASIDISDCSLEAWVCLLPYSRSGWKTIFSKVSQANLQIYLDGNDKLGHYNSTSSGGVLYNTAFNENEWNHFICVEDGSDVRTYVNGVLQSTKTISLQMDSDGDFSIGSKPDILADEIAAQIAQPRIYNRALTASEVLRNYNSGKNTYTND